MKCPSCRQTNPSNARFCRSCGHALDRTTGRPAESFYSSRGYLIWAALGSLLVLLILFGSFAFGGGVFALLAIGALAFLGGLLWTGATGRWPGGRRRVNRVIRVLMPILPLAANGFVGVLLGLFLTTCSGDFFCGDSSLEVGIAIGLGFFLGLALLETMLFLMAWSMIRAGRLLLRGG